MKMGEPLSLTRVKSAIRKPRKGVTGKSMIFKDRSDAGKQLADTLAERLKDNVDTITLHILALPRGGVPVAFEIAQRLKAPLDTFIVRKLGLPGNEELAMGAIASGGSVVLNESLIQQLQVPRSSIDLVMRQESKELERRESLYNSGYIAQEIKGKNIILIDDGLATGASLQVAVLALRPFSPATITVAVPVAAQRGLDELRMMVDNVISLQILQPEESVSHWYDDFTQTTHVEVINLLQKAHGRKIA